MYKWLIHERIMWKTKVSTFHVSKSIKYHSHTTRSIFLFPIPLVIPQETIEYPAVGRRDKEETRGKEWIDCWQ